MKSVIKRSLVGLYCWGLLPVGVVDWAFRRFGLRGE